MSMHISPPLYNTKRNRQIRFDYLKFFLNFSQYPLELVSISKSKRSSSHFKRREQKMGTHSHETITICFACIGIDCVSTMYTFQIQIIYIFTFVYLANTETYVQYQEPVLIFPIF